MPYPSWPMYLMLQIVVNYIGQGSPDSNCNSEPPLLQLKFVDRCCGFAFIIVRGDRNDFFNISCKGCVGLASHYDLIVTE